MSHSASYEDGHLIITRIFDAPRPLVFDAWIKKSLVQLWWGCGYATNVESEIDSKVGGHYSHTMTLQEIGDYEHKGYITEYEPPELLAYRLTDSYHNSVMMVRIEFIAQNSQTLVRLTQSNLPDAYSEYVMAGWLAGFEKLAELLGQPKYRKKQEIIS